MFQSSLKNTIRTYGQYIVFGFLAFTASVVATAQSSTDNGIDFGASYSAGYQAPPINSSAGSSHKQRLTLNMAADLEKIFGVKNGSFFFQYQNHNGQNGSDNIGDIQRFDGLDDPEYDRIHMLWYQHIFADGKLRIKVGKVEPLSEFFYPENAKHHLGFSTTRSGTIFAQGPPSMSLNAFYSPTDKFTLAIGVYDATWNRGRDENDFRFHNPFKAEDVAIFLEGRFKWDNGIAGLPGGMKVGAWQLTAEQVRFDGGQSNGTNGIYVLVDQTLTDNGMGVYAQYGYADQQVVALSSHIGFGMQWIGPFAERENDIFGVGYSRVTFSDAIDAPFIKEAETAYELFYKAPLNDWFTVQADLQAIDNPGGLGAPDVLVFTTRATISF